MNTYKYWFIETDVHFSQGFAGDLPFRYEVTTQRFEDCLCFHHQSERHYPKLWIVTARLYDQSPEKTSLRSVAMESSDRNLLFL